MTADEIEDLAMMNLPLPDDAPASDRFYFTVMRCLHSEHRHGDISREQASIEKRRLLAEREKLAEGERYALHTGKLWAGIEAAVNTYEQDKTTENADRLIESIYGVPVTAGWKRGEAHELEKRSNR